MAAYEKKERPGTTFDTRYPNPQLEINGEEVDLTNGEYGPDVMSDYIIDFIKRYKEKPFMAYYPMVLPHCPFSPTPDSESWNPKSLGSETYKGDKALFKDHVAFIDKIIGKFITALDEAGLRENTIIFFTGDNGTDSAVISQWNDTKVKGGKGQVKDEGTRTPFIVNWKGTWKPRVDEEELVEFSDMMPTFCELAGAPLPENYKNDGLSLVPSLNQEEHTRNKPYIHISYKNMEWIRNKHYGIYKDKNEKTYQHYYPNNYEVQTDRLPNPEKAQENFVQLESFNQKLKIEQANYPKKTKKKKGKKNKKG